MRVRRHSIQRALSLLHPQCWQLQPSCICPVCQWVRIMMLQRRSSADNAIKAGRVAAAQTVSRLRKLSRTQPPRNILPRRQVLPGVGQAQSPAGRALVELADGGGLSSLVRGDVTHQQRQGICVNRGRGTARRDCAGCSVRSRNWVRRVQPRCTKGWVRQEMPVTRCHQIGLILNFAADDENKQYARVLANSESA
jgi:hypothetical protein